GALALGGPAVPLPRAAALGGAALAAGCVGTLGVVQGDRAFEAGDAARAAAAYQRALAGGSTPRLELAAGAALYELKRYDEAQQRFLAALPAPGPERALALYDLGNAYVRSAELAPEKTALLDKAIQAYEEALVLSPGDRDIQWNLEVALERRGSTIDPGSAGRGGRAIAGEGNGREEGLDESRESAVAAMAGGGQGAAEGESAKELDEAEARKLLEALEREQLASHDGRPGRRGKRADRDW
ncbi:MAG: hypothetical protein NW201_01725, partial [Gemmatimonadales bacterium]|nr:hypothetical protein [Gemmatimonadales bacterium]